MNSAASYSNTQPSKVSYRRILQILLSRWYWILSIIFISTLFTYVKLCFTSNTYATEASLKFEEKRSEISELINIRNVYDRSNKLQSEQFVIRSREVLLNAARKLNYNISYSKVGYFNNLEMYPVIPFKIAILKKAPDSNKNQAFDITPIGDDQFILQYEGATELVSRTCRVKDLLTLSGLSFMIPDKFKTEQLHHTYLIRFNKPEELLKRINDGLTITENKNTNILTFKQVDKNPVFAADILNAILEEYVNHDQGQKTQSATQTIAFIDTLQRKLSKVVSNSGTIFEKFKINSRMLDVSGTTNLAMQKLEQLEKQKADLRMIELRINQIDKDLMGNLNPEGVNVNLQEIANPVFSNLLLQYNGLLLKKQSQLGTYKTGSETVKQIESQLQILKQTLVKNIDAQKQKNFQAHQFLNQQIQQQNKLVNTIPTSEKNFVNLQSDLDVNQKVLSYLNQKKLEAQISRASITPAATIVNKAIYQFKPISPVKSNAYKTAILIGLVSGIGLIFLIRVLNPYIYDRETLEQLTDIPVIGVIRKFPGLNPGTYYDLRKVSKTRFTESVCTIRTNVSFLAPDITKKVICITSETSGEGKSFTAINLAQALSLIDKRVIVLEADLRKSKCHHAFETKDDRGLSNYLSGQVSLEEITVNKSDNLFFISGGPIPPNPSELLYSHKMAALIEELKGQYDFIIIDSAPAGLVSDALPILKLADINLFIIRAGLSRYHAASLPEQLSRTHSLCNFHIILNAFNHDTLHSPYYRYKNYGSKSPYYADVSEYDHGYFDDSYKKKWWKLKGFTA